MNEFELDLSLEYFNLVNETMRSSKYSKQVRNYISDIDSYNALLEEYNFLLSSKEDEIVVQENLNQYNIHCLQKCRSKHFYHLKLLLSLQFYNKTGHFL